MVPASKEGQVREPLAKGQIDEAELLSLDLLRLNNGRRPYPEGDLSFERAFARGIDFYRNLVVNRVGFTGAERVLDLLCGYGRWSLFLAEQNQHVVGIDVLEDCTRLATNLCRHFGFNNTEFLTGDVSLTGRFPDNHFDCVWMWSAMQYVERGAVLAEVFRILKPGGRLYVGNYNGPGLMVDHLINGARRGAIDQGAAQWALNSLVRGEESDGNPNYLSPNQAESVLARYGLRLVVACEEGRLDLSVPDHLRKDAKPRLTELGLVRTIEFLAEKPRERPTSPVMELRDVLRSRLPRQTMPVGVLADGLLLGNADVQTQQAARARMVKSGAVAVPILAALLVDDDNLRSNQAKQGLREMGAEALPVLLECLQNGLDPHLTQAINEVVGEIAPGVSTATTGHRAQLNRVHAKAAYMSQRVRNRLSWLVRLGGRARRLASSFRTRGS